MTPDDLLDPPCYPSDEESEREELRIFFGFDKEDGCSLEDLRERKREWEKQREEGE